MADLAKVADALADLDSHSLYDRRALADLEAAGIEVDRLSHQTREEARESIESRGLGGWIDPDGPDELYTGWVVSDEVVEQLGLAPAGRMFHGRGSAHRANIEQLRQAASAPH